MRAEAFTTFGVFVVMLSVYALTGGPGLGLVDSGELTAASYTLGIPHPTGYPLYSLLGRCVHIANIAVSPARAMVLFSAVAGAAMVSILSLLASRLLTNRAPSLSEISKNLYGALLAISFGITYSAWCSVSFAEVYPLTCLIGAMIILMTVMHQSAQGGRSITFLVGAFYLWGIGFGNHLTILWFLPVMILILVRQMARQRNKWRAFFWCLAAAALGASINLYLPVRSAVEPPYDWGDPQRIPELWRHITAWQYRVWMFQGDVNSLLEKFASTVAALPRDLSWGLTGLAVIGIINAVAKKETTVIALLLTWLVGVTYNLNYDISDISTYFLLFQVPLFAISAHGFAIVLQRVSRLRQYRIIGVLVALIPFALNAGMVDEDVNQSRNDFAEEYARAVVRTLPDSALVFQANWDIQSPFGYLQDVEQFRTDIAMLDVNLMQRSWYVKQAQRRYPSVFDGCQREVEEFLRQVRPFESGDFFDSKRLERAFVALHNRIIELRIRHRPVYIRGMREINHPGIGDGFQQFPGGYFLRVTSSYSPEPVLDVASILGGRSRFSERELMMLSDAARSTVRQGMAAMAYDDTSTLASTRVAVKMLGIDEPFVRRFLEDAGAFMMRKSGE